MGFVLVFLFLGGFFVVVFFEWRAVKEVLRTFFVSLGDIFSHCLNFTRISFFSQPSKDREEHAAHPIRKTLLILANLHKVSP